MAVIGALLAGVPITPINPKAGSSELEHILDDSAPEIVLCAPGAEPDVATERRVDVDLEARGGDLPGRAGRGRAGDRRLHVRHDRPAEGRRPAAPRRSPPTSTRSPRRGSGPRDDVVAHALPLFHVHGLILGTLGPVRRGGGMHHLGRFSAEAAAAALEERRDDAVRGPDDVPPPRRRGRGRRASVARGFAQCAAARLRLGRAPGRRARADRAAHRPADRRALRHDRDADEHRRARRRRAPPRLRRARRSTASRCGWSTTTATRSRPPTTRRSARSTSAARTSSSSTSTAPTRPPRR